MQEQLSDVERLLIAQSLYSKLGSICSTKGSRGGDGLRAQMDEQYKALFEQTGAKSFAMRFNGEPVATYSISTTSAKSGEETVVFDLVDNDAYDEWLGSLDSLDLILNFVDSKGTEFCEYMLRETGEVPPGVEMRVERTPDEPGGKYRCGMIKDLKADRVLESMDAERLPVARVVGLLEQTS